MLREERSPSQAGAWVAFVFFSNRISLGAVSHRAIFKWDKFHSVVVTSP